MNILALAFLALLTVVKSQAPAPTNQTEVAVPALNQTDLEAAMTDMRIKSYYGFVILLRLLNTTSNALQIGDITFLMPNDQILSKTELGVDNLQEFILSHSIPTALVLNNLLHFPSGTLVPSTFKGKMLSITNNGRSGLLINNAKLVDPNICTSSFIKCHGISTSLTFDGKMLESGAPSELTIHNTVGQEN